MSKYTLSEFKSKLSGGGARPNLFQVNLEQVKNAITGVTFDPDTNMLIKAASLPASNVAPVEVPFRGRIFKVAGDRTFDTWTITIINDTDFSIREGFESWMQKIAQYADASGQTAPQSYMTDIQVDQLSRNASSMGGVEGAGLNVVKSYIFYDVFPTNISAIDLSYDTGDTIEEFTVEFQVQYWRAQQNGPTIQ